MTTAGRFAALSRRAGRGDLWNRQGLSSEQRHAAVIAGLVALKIGPDRLSEDLAILLAEGCGLSLAEDTIRQMAAYTGYPNAAQAMAALDVASNGRPGAQDAGDQDPIHPPSDAARYEVGITDYGKLNAEALATIRTAFDEIAPDLANLTFRAFGDVFASSAQPLALRQIATVAALACMGSAAPQLRFHYGAAFNIGVTQAQLVEVILLVQYLAGMPAAYNALVELKAAITSAGEPPPYR